MQQTPNKQLTNLSSWAYFLGMGVAIGAGSIGIAGGIITAQAYKSLLLGLLSWYGCRHRCW